MVNALPVLLVVDDDDDVRLALKLYLEAEGYEVDEAPNGREALARLRAGLRPKLIVLDLMMPLMNGWEFREEQKASPELRDIPVVIFTATGLNARTTDDITVLPKPVDATQLLEVVRKTADP
jgi:CheY-like chemotaxis protein